MEGDGYWKHYLKPRDRKLPEGMDKLEGATMAMQRELPPTPGADYTGQSRASARNLTINAAKAEADAWLETNPLPTLPPE
jgi:hypothetical protein